MNRWDKLKVNAFVRRFCYGCRNHLHADATPPIPLDQLNYSNWTKPLHAEAWQHLTAYVCKHARTIAELDSSLLYAKVYYPTEVELAGPYIVQLMKKYYHG